MAAVAEAAPVVGVRAACEALAVPRASYYRHQAPAPTLAPRKPPARALTPEERSAVLDVLHEPRFVDLPPAQVYNTLLDEGSYLCSPSTMYRILAEHDEVRERRDQLRHPAYQAPELLATRPNQVWSWDITKLRGPEKWSYFYAYVILDVFSRYVVGWMVAPAERADLAEDLIAITCERQQIPAGQLTLHADRGASMTSKQVAHLLADLGVTRTHSRPHVSDDNPYSEANFKTLKYRPDFPDRFGSLQHAREHLLAFFDWYNYHHHHSGIAFLTPEVVHFGRAQQILDARQAVRLGAHQRHPERFVQGAPNPQKPPAAAWINPPRLPQEPPIVLGVDKMSTSSLVERSST